jgi:asparagine synthase (glutamine-hydrolysing)
MAPAYRSQFTFAIPQTLRLNGPHTSPEFFQAAAVSFDRAEYDEGALAQEMAASVGAQFCPIPIRHDDLADHFSDGISQSETFCFNAHGVAKYLLSRSVRDAGYKVVLTGEGSDEILGGSAHFRRDMLLYNTQGQDPNVLAALLRQLDDTNPVSRGLLLPDGKARPLERVKNLLGFVPSWIETFSARSEKMRALLSNDFLQRFLVREGYQPFAGCRAPQFSDSRCRVCRHFWQPAHEPQPELGHRRKGRAEAPRF